MDFLTHPLAGAGAARLISPQRELRPQLCLAAVIASLLPDADSWLYLLGPNMYGRYHRVVSHTVWGLALIALVSAGIAWSVTYVRPWRRFGWFVCPNLPAPLGTPRHAGFGWCVLAALAAVMLHWLLDIITGFGNLRPFWPWSQWDASQHAVESFDWFILFWTLAWHATTRQLDMPRRKEALAGVVYAAVVAAYALLRLRYGHPTVW
jgi:membrane-bound metal-dependent hydrolase YbcI (DUF457 family)